MTVIVTAKRISASSAYRPQPYSLVITGQLRPKYDSSPYPTPPHPALYAASYGIFTQSCMQSPSDSFLWGSVVQVLGLAGGTTGGAA